MVKGVPSPSGEPSAPSPANSATRLSPRRLAANRLNARKSTGPRTRAGKFRSALNAEWRRLLPEKLERELRARGEDPREFCCLHRDLAAIFHPGDEATSTAVELLARAWWQKARRVRQWVGAGAPRLPELDARIEALLVVVVRQLQKRKAPWKGRLVQAIGTAIRGPAEVRRQIEGKLRPFGAKPGSWKYRTEADRKKLEEQFEGLVGQVLAELARLAQASEAKPTQPA